MLAVRSWLVSLVGFLLLVGGCGGEPAGQVTSAPPVTPPPATTSTVQGEIASSTVPPSAAPTTSAVPTTSVTSTSLAPVFVPGSLPLVAEEVVASDDGVFLVLHGDGAPIVQLWDQPAAVAFMVGEDLVVAQGATVDDVYPRWAEGPIMVFDPDGARSLPLDEERLTLFDAAVIDGRPVALATSRTGDGPDDTDERLVLVDLITEERTDLASVGGWESGVSQAVLADGRVALISGGEGNHQVVVRSLSGIEQWALTQGPETFAVLTVRGSELILLHPGFTEPKFTPTITLDRYNLDDGSSLGTTNLTLQLGEGVHIDGGFCFTAEWLGEALVCDQTYGGPLLIDVFNATVGHFGGFDKGVLTIPRPAGQL